VLWIKRVITAWKANEDLALNAVRKVDPVPASTLKAIQCKSGDRVRVHLPDCKLTQLEPCYMRLASKGNHYGID